MSVFIPELYIKRQRGIARCMRLLAVLSAALRSVLGPWEVPPLQNIWLVALFSSNLNAFWMETLIFYLPIHENIFMILLLTASTVAGNVSLCSISKLAELLPNFQSAAAAIQHLLLINNGYHNRILKVGNIMIALFFIIARGMIKILR